MKHNTFINTYRDKILAIANSHGAVNVQLFGSFSRAEEQDQSDIDLLVEIKESLINC